MKSIIVILAVIFTLGLLMGCSGASKDSETADGEKGSDNLCVEYKSCNECIAGLKANRKLNHKTAQTECSMAASGCWATWEKPVKCDDEK